MKITTRVFCKLLAVVSILAQAGLAYSDGAEMQRPFNYALEKIVFVIEVTGVGPATDPAKLINVSSKLGADRIREYHEEKKLLPLKFNPNAILSMSAAEADSHSHAIHIAQAMFPL